MCMLNNTGVHWPLGWLDSPGALCCPADCRRRFETTHRPPSFISCLLFIKISTQPTNCAHLPFCQPCINETIIQSGAGPCCNRLVSTNCQIKRSERIIRPTFSRISNKLPPSMFGSTHWHPVEHNTPDTLTRHVKKNKNKPDLLEFLNQHHVASLHVAAEQLRRVGRFATGKGS